MKQTSQKNQGELLLEIGTEEIPSSYLDSLRTPFNSFVQLVKTAIEERLGLPLDEKNFKGYQTPRRIILHVQGLPTQREITEEIVGPKKEICYQADGKPTPVLEGFLKSKKGSFKDLVEEGGRVVIRRVQKVTTAELLKEELPSAIRLLGFPKMMRWDETDLRFPRPIRSLLCLYKNTVLSFSLGTLKTGNKTYGWGPFKGKEKVIRSAKDYFAFLKKEGILLEEERKSFIQKEVAKELKKRGGSPEKIDQSLLNEVSNLVEKPVVFSGTLNTSYRLLPKEVLIASMSKYQRVFPVEDPKGELLPFFVACANGSPSVAKIRKNYEHVLNARLEDAMFFFKEDTRDSFADKRNQLTSLIYHQKLGTMYDKSERMKRLASVFGKRVSLDQGLLERASELAKNDLVTEMVKEFPSLQGIVGYSYAKKSGEKEEVALAIREQYLPKGDLLQEFPESDYGAALSFLEKLDHVVGCFYAGESPTGSSDPYGLRRAANALFKIILSRKWDFSFSQMIEASRELLDNSLTAQKERGEKLLAFLEERLKAIFKEASFREDLIEAVVRDVDRPIPMREKLISLSDMMERRYHTLFHAFKVVERTHNILKPIQPHERQGIGEVRPDLFQDEIEKNLWKLYNTKRSLIEKLIRENAWAEATAEYGEVFSETLHQFFEKVLVNVEDESLRRNRLALMKEINELYTDSVADLSKLRIAV